WQAVERGHDPRATIDVLVREGIVTFTGSVFDERQRRALHVLAENVAGVKGVHDHMVWIEPVSGMVIESDEDRKGG
ncbi:MAG: BON domain-containing protein, partial [Pseudorhodoplanes sp.]|nr:BON domain-containing protein [Pseudorhodoplanes sp.]